MCWNMEYSSSAAVSRRDRSNTGKETDGLKTHTHTHTHARTPSHHNEYLSQVSLQNTDIGVGYSPGRGEICEGRPGNKK